MTQRERVATVEANAAKVFFILTLIVSSVMVVAWC